jgi:flagellar protein FlaI
MEREMQRRVEILDHMRKIGVNNYRQVAKIISAYYRNPEKLMKEVREKTVQT